MSPFWPTLEPGTAAAETSLRRLSASIAVASGLAMSGRAVDVQGLDAVAGLLCAQVLDLDPADGSSIRPALCALERDIGSLITTIQAQAR